VPYELETEAQILFERYGGFARGFKRNWYRVDCGSDGRAATHHGGAGKFGTGANMAYRRSLFDRIGYFDPALDVGTATNGGGDLEMFFRVLKAGYVLVYEPRAVVRHRHRREYAQLRTQITNNGIGFYSYLVRSALAYPDERFTLLRLGLWWLWWWNIRRLLISFVRPGRFPRDLILAELRGSFTGLGRYQQARCTAGKITATFGPLTPPIVTVPKECAWRQTVPKDPNAVAVRIIDLGQPLCALTDVTGYTNVRVFIASNGLLLSSVDIANHGQPISTAWLRDSIADRLTRNLVVPGANLSTASVPSSPLAALGRCPRPITDGAVAMPAKLPNDVSAFSASVVVATYDRPDGLRNCLRCLVAQKSPRQVEIVVVDNNPTSGLTPPIVAEFPNVVLVSEHRKGLSYARNAGISTSKGDIVITTDDDVTMPPDWLEKLVTPFARADVMIVTGNTLPLELETRAQRLFET
jgi:GT2 family glycosyltransferase